MTDETPESNRGSLGRAKGPVLIFLLASVLSVTGLPSVDLGSYFGRDARVMEKPRRGRAGQNPNSSGDGGSVALDRSDTGGVGTDRGSGEALGSRGLRDSSRSSRGAASSSSPKLHVNRTNTFYDVTGANARALWDDIERKGPRLGSELAIGLTSANTHWEKAYEPAPSGSCRVRRVKVRVDIEVTLPRWKNSADGPRGLRERWRAFVEAVTRHERRHQEIAISAGRRLRHVISVMKAPSCARLRRRASRRAREILREANARQQRFDERDDGAGAHLLRP